MIEGHGTTDVGLRATNPVCALLTLLVILPALLLVPCDVLAHEIWLEQTDQGLVLLSGHTGATHGERELREYPPEEVMRAQCYDEKGSGGEISYQPVYPVTLPNSCAVVYVLTSSGYWTKTPFGTKRVPKDQAKGPLESWLSYESVKRIDAWSEDIAGPVTEDLEISPTGNPFVLCEGKKVRLLATIGGEPVEGVTVAYDGKPRGVTDDGGRVNIRLRHGGMQMIQASYSQPGDSIKADEIVHSTTLIFDMDTDD